MLKRILRRGQRLIRRTFDNEKYPAIHSWYKARDERRRRESYERNQRMSYAEIEAEIGGLYKRLFLRELDWDNPKTYNEKIIVSKIYMSTPLKTKLADKYAVREWITEKIGAQYIIPLLGVYNSFDEIDFDALPEQFVIKCNHDSGSAALVKNKSILDVEALRQKINAHMKINYAWETLEMQYKDIPRKIVIEQYMGDAINDYKFMCLGGKVYCCWVDVDRFSEHRRNFYDMDWNLLPMKLHHDNYSGTIERPEHFDTMKEVASKLCADFDQVRVDLYFIDGRIYFGEMTFSTLGGYTAFTPDEWDYKLGELWPFDNTIRKKVLASHSKP